MQINEICIWYLFILQQWASRFHGIDDGVGSFRVLLDETTALAYPTETVLRPFSLIYTYNHSIYTYTLTVTEMKTTGSTGKLFWQSWDYKCSLTSSFGAREFDKHLKVLAVWTWNDWNYLNVATERNTLLYSRFYLVYFN